MNWLAIVTAVAGIVAGMVVGYYVCHIRHKMFFKFLYGVLNDYYDAFDKNLEKFANERQDDPVVVKIYNEYLKRKGEMK